MTVVDDSAHRPSFYRYNKGCRCDGCKAIKRAAAKAYYESNIDALRQKAAADYETNGDRIRERNRQWYHDNREAALAYAANRRRNNPEVVERGRAAVARWRSANLERARDLDRAQRSKPESKARQRQWVENNRDKVNSYSRAWALRPGNDEKIRLAAKRRRARLKSADVREVSERDWKRLLHRQCNRCFYCDSSEQMTADHVIPLSRGGRHSIGNIVAACKSCNSSKHDRLIVEWMVRHNA